MRRKLYLLIVIMMALIGLVEAEELVPVIVFENEDFNGYSTNSIDFEEKIKHRYSSFDGYSAVVSEEEFDRLKQNPRYKVFRDKEYFAHLDVSTVNVNADDVNDLKIGSLNLTGAGQTICVIDSGVNYTHPSLGGCYGDNNVSTECKVIGGWDFVNADSDPMDDYGHGTHVTGILISNDTTYPGVAQGVKIISIKTLDNVGVGSGVNILAGIDWCINNASIFNITVISMSLGDCSNSSSYCDGGSFFTNGINTAIANGINVVVSGGNGNVGSCSGINETFGLSDPACVENATAVGAVNDTDGVHATYQRWGLFQLMAPGVSVTSTLNDGISFGDKSGTSMAVPHVSGLIAILKQIYSAQGDGNLTSNNAKSIINNTGLNVNDLVSGRNYSRIDFLAAILSEDRTVPVVGLISPTNGLVNLSQNKTFSCNASDWLLSNVTIKVWNTTGLYYNSTVNLTGTQNSSSFNLTDMPYDTYNWNCFYMDSKGNEGYFASNYSLTIGGLSVLVSSPENNTYTNVNQTNVTCQVNSSAVASITNVTVNVWNSTGFLASEYKNLTGINNFTTFTINTSNESTYLINCEAYNNQSYSSSGDENTTINYDSTAPVVSSVSVSSITSSGAIISWTTDEEANSSLGSGVNGSSSSYVTSHSITLTSLTSDRNYVYYVKSCDRSNNCGTSTPDSFRTLVASTGGGGGGGSSSSTGEASEYLLGENQFLIGFNKILVKDDRIHFYVNNSLHTLIVNQVSINGIGVTIRSDPLNVTIPSKGILKVNLSSDKYYDLLLTGHGINGGLANITIKKIWEEINFSELVDENLADEDRGGEYYAMEDDGSLELGFGEFNLLRLIFSFLPALIIIGIIVFFLIRKRKSKELKESKSKKGDINIRHNRKRNGKEEKKKVEYKAISKG